MVKKEIKYTKYQSPVGTIFLAVSSKGLLSLFFTESESEFLDTMQKKYGEKPESYSLSFGKIFNLLDRYFNGEAVEFDIKIDLAGTPFRQSVWAELRKIPYGSTLTYGQVARVVGNPAASRAVGGACGANPLPVVVPCHRVVASGGGLGGYSAGEGLVLKKKLLLIEGVKTFKRKAFSGGGDYLSVANILTFGFPSAFLRDT